MRLSLLIFVLSSLGHSLISQPAEKDIEKVVFEVNKLRKRGCFCGGKWMPPVRPVQWDHTLYEASKRYARYMYNNDHFSHFSKTGEDLGDRLDLMGYQWKKIGENIGFGYRDFYGVFAAWKKSDSHCEMLMDPEVTQMGISKYYTYWVQSFSKPLSQYYGAR